MDATVHGMLAAIYFNEAKTEKALAKLEYLNRQYPESEHAFQASILAGYVSEDGGLPEKAQVYYNQAASMSVAGIQQEEKEELLSGLQRYLESNGSTGPAEPFVQEEEDTGSKELALSNYPNPFNPVTNIRFTLPQKHVVSLAVYDLVGRKVATLVNETLAGGKQTIRLDASNLANGMYMYKLRVGSEEIIRKMRLIK